MKLSVALRPEARADLSEIWSYTADRWDIGQADAYVSAIQTKIAAAAINPNLGSDCSDVYPGIRRTKSGSHLIYYLATDALLDVVRILHQRRDPFSLL